MKIWALHGFLGLPSDFGLLQQKCEAQVSGLQWQSVDYMHSRELSPQTSLAQWGEKLVKLVKASSKDLSAGDNILLGYSQGGRLALQALKADPELWQAVILLSANPGIASSERPARLRNDQDWANQFLNQNFQKTVEKWNSQAVFNGSLAEPLRNEEQFNRHQLADSLTNWSVANQDDFRDLLKSVTLPVLYISGKKDIKYAQVGQSLAAANAKIQHRSLENAGHRVFFDQPDAVAFEISKFIQPLCL